MSSDYDKPFDLLKELCGDTVDINRRDDSVVRATMQTFGQHINIALTDVTISPEGSDAQLQKSEDRWFQRGSGVIDVRPADTGDADE